MPGHEKVQDKALVQGRKNKEGNEWQSKRHEEQEDAVRERM